MNKVELKQRAKELLEFAQDESKKHSTRQDLNNAIFGIGAKAGQLFPTPDDRDAFLAMPEHKKIKELIASLPSRRIGVANPDDPSGVVSVRMPKSLHRSLILEAQDEGTSLNQLITTKLAARLSESVHN